MKFLLIICLISSLAYGFDKTNFNLEGTDPYLKMPNYKVGLQGDTFRIGSETEPILTFKDDGDVTLDAEKLEVDSLNILGDFILGTLPQWKLIHTETFEQPHGWTNNTTTACAGTQMLGGHCRFGEEEVSKTFTNIPPHKQVKIQATYHYIDAWMGESAWMKASFGDGLHYVWSETYDSSGANIDVCGGRHSESKFASPIEVNIPHEQDDLTVTFGTTMTEDPCD